MPSTFSIIVFAAFMVIVGYLAREVNSAEDFVWVVIKYLPVAVLVGVLAGLLEYLFRRR